MGNKLRFQMEWLLFHKQGFTLLEMLIVLLVVSVLSFSSVFVLPKLTVDTFENEYILHQLKALSQHNTQEFKHGYSSNVPSLSFNSWGNVNMAQTIQVKNKTYTIQLGAGRYEKK